MRSPALAADAVQALQAAFGERLQQGLPLAPHTSARIGGPADFALTARSAAELAASVLTLWDLGVPFRVLGGGSNVLVSDRGVREVVVLNQARQVRFESEAGGARAWAESGASLGALARRAAARGWAGLEWAATVPGTVGGAVVGNAGAHGGDMTGSLIEAEVARPGVQSETWPGARLEYGYRTSWLKRNPGQSVVLGARFGLEVSDPETVRARVATFVEQRRRTQPPGASMGSMFKNPPGDFAGRLIDQAGLKGARQGGAEISPQHANFFVNREAATAADVLALIRQARQTVAERSGVRLELEVELVGEWTPEDLEGLARAGGAA